MAIKLKKLTDEAPRPAVQEILAAAREADPTTPPVRAKTPPIPAAPEPVVGLNIRCRISTSEAIAWHAAQEGKSMKALVMHALAEKGIHIAPDDMEDRSPSRRKGR
ncbi:hypothetical protein [Teichococcus vastitatis]|uniref:Plasmid segregation centromere-binding protein ParG n=1 Tax=Teichococcus vastitatis TaxID=2307076 RepID=A0ABS9W9F8_9PROT|nr:hypothetical protein [Pseudoroseomonas vastitatis]MCI0755618.1 hypothetical protein [Pseudoroseomonas vastitatis]